MTRKYLTLSQIKGYQPCTSAWRKVRRLFGRRQRIEVTVKRAVALAQQFDFEWLARRTLSPTNYAEYERAEAPALAEYERATAPALAEYERATAPAWAAIYINAK